MAHLLHLVRRPMGTRLAVVCPVLLLTACVRIGGESNPAAEMQPADGILAVATASVVHAGPQSPGGSSVATLPDRGDLVDYVPAATRREGPSIWHQANISEEHALRAIASGRLRVTAPDGRQLEYRYQRHVEHPDGNWTWVGELPDLPGAQAVITFGERAVFGQLGRSGADPLQLSTRNGLTWIVEVPPGALKGVDAPGRGAKADYLIAPDNFRSAVAGKLADGALTEPTTVQATASTTTAGQPTVDVLLGYTAGFATGLGGRSQAVTRLTHLVAVTNQAYLNSKLNVQVRLVGTLQVAYADKSSNNTTLDELTGSTGSKSITVPAALQPLRQAREQLGADLVSLVRKFDNATHDGCGVAWLIGGGGSGVDAFDHPWGYSVVSDGSDSGYYCRSETLAHELGHNMGQNHNVEDSGGDAGAHPYSYGYRESSATGFYTIMSYRSGDSQHSISYFANPNVLVDGRPTGIGNESDNVRSMAQTMPVAAAFRAAVVNPPSFHNDVNGDAKSDVILHRPGSLAYWIMAGTTISRSKSFSVASDWRVVGTGDLDNDGRMDMVMMNSSREVYAWLGNGISFTAYRIAQLASGFVVVGTGDVDRDGKDDVLLYRSGQLVHWVMDGGRIVRSSTHAVAAGFTAVAAGDFDADTRADVAFINSAGDLYAWLGTAGEYAKSFVARINTSFSVKAAQDVDGDGKSDLLLVRPGQIVQFFMDGSRVSRSRSLSLSTSYTVATTGDFNGDMRGDIMLQHVYNRSLYVWLGTSTGYASSSLVMPASGYVLVP